MKKAYQLIEHIYEIALNPDQPYYDQLEPLAATGDLANRTNVNKVVFGLCELVDAQQKEIQALKDDREAIAKQMVELEKKINPSTVTVDITPVDPTKPLASTGL